MLKLRSYVVTATLKHAPAGIQDDVLVVQARTTAEAIKKALAMVERHCLFDRHDGPLVCAAREV